MFLRLVLCFGVALLLAGAAAADVPQLINYQGILLDTAGDPVTTPTTVLFAIWNADFDGDSLWSEEQSVSPDDEGRFSVLLGAVSPIPDLAFAGAETYMSVKVDTDPEMVPRSRVVSVGYAYRVATVDGTTGGTISGNVAIQSNLDVNGNLRATGKGTIGPGHTNTGTDAFVAGIINTASGFRSTVGGGFNNTASGFYATVGGGYSNTASDDWPTVGGGNRNTAGGRNATVGGGYLNVATGTHATVPGGDFNTASGAYSFAAGRNAKANHDGAFVWGDGTNADIASSAANEFRVRASGGVWFYTNSTLTSGVTVPAGGGAWAAVSDREMKRNIRPVDGAELLEKLAQLEVSRWSYNTQDEGIEHIGPMAQDLYRLFGVGDNDKTISTIDPDGIALAAIQQLHQQNQEQQKEIAELKELVRQLLADKE